MTASANTSTVTDVVLTRIFDAAPEAVFTAHIDPAQIPLWWGPRGLRTRVDELDARPGGRWQFVQHDADNVEHRFHGFYHAVQPPTRLIYTFEYAGAGVLLKSISLDDLDGRTRLTDRSAFLSAADRGAALNAGMREGTAESFGRLAVLLSH
jgi:uncharacterized protein YndB with AHSA1/START domain